MYFWFLLPTTFGVLTLVGLLRWHTNQRSAVYRTLAEKRSALIQGCAPVLETEADTTQLANTFARDFLIHVDHFVSAATLRQLREEGLANQPRLKRSFVPTHKKGGTVSYEQLHKYGPHCLAFYHAPAVQEWVSAAVGRRVRAAADHDQSACSLLFYTEEGDHIQWHYDHNFYRGRQFTLLLSLVNECPTGGTSASRLTRKDAAGQEIGVDTPENTMVLFEGSRVVHKVSPSGAGDRRVVLSMTFNTDPRISWTGEALRRLKDVAFFGVRALWR